MALANYMGSGLGLLGIGNVNYADLSTLGRQPAATSSKAPKTTTAKDEDYDGYTGDAQYQSELNRAFQTEYKKALSNYGNDPAFFHSTDEYDDLVDKYQRNTVGNKAAAVATKEQGDAFKTHITTRGNGTSSRQLMMQFDDNSQSWVPQIDERTSDFTTKGQWLWGVQQHANVDQSGNLVTPNWDMQTGNLNTVREEFSKELNDAGHRLQSGATKTVEEYESGDRSEGTDLSIKKTYDHTWSHKNNIGELTSAADMLSRDITDETEYAMAQEVYQLARSEGKAWYPVFEVNEKGEKVSVKGKDGRIQFEKVDLESDQIMDPAFMKHASRFEPLRHVQNMKRTREEREDSETTDDRIEEDYGYAYTGGGDDESGKQIWESAQNGIFPEGSEQPTEVITQKNGKPIVTQDIVRRRNENNTPAVDWTIAKAMDFGKTIGQVISQDNPQILIGGNKWNSMADADGDVNNFALTGFKIIDMVDFGEAINPDPNNPEMVPTIKYRVMVDEDFLSNAGLTMYDKNGQSVVITDDVLGYDYIPKDLKRQLGISFHSDVEDIHSTVFDKNNEMRSAEDINAIHPGEGWNAYEHISKQAGKSAYVMEVEVLVDNLSDRDKDIYQGLKKGTTDFQERRYQLQKDRANNALQNRANNPSIDYLEGLAQSAGTNNSGNFAGSGVLAHK